MEKKYLTEFSFISDLLILKKKKKNLLKIYIKLYGSDISPLSQEKET